MERFTSCMQHTGPTSPAHPTCPATATRQAVHINQTVVVLPDGALSMVGSLNATLATLGDVYAGGGHGCPLSGSRLAASSGQWAACKGA